MDQNIQHGISIFRAHGDKYRDLFSKVLSNVSWDNSMRSRKTASFGVPYNYSNIEYLRSEFPSFIDDIIDDIMPKLGYRPNNCLINYYERGCSKMGFHADKTDILMPFTGITILSLGNHRTMRFKNKSTGELRDFLMEPSSFLHMTAEIQHNWLHAILSDLENDNQRISITFRRLIDTL